MGEMIFSFLNFIKQGKNMKKDLESALNENKILLEEIRMLKKLLYDIELEYTRLIKK